MKTDDHTPLCLATEEQIADEIEKRLGDYILVRVGNREVSADGIYSSLTKKGTEQLLRLAADFVMGYPQ